MKTRFFDWKKAVSESELSEVAEILTRGGVVIFPTDTVYGIGCNCFDEEAIHRIYDFKHRPLTKPTNILTDSVTKFERVAKPLNDIERRLAEKYLPGALTLILDKLDCVPDCLTAGLPTVGVRIPDERNALKILQVVDFPLATTSVNFAGEAPGIEVADFIAEFEGKVDAIIDGGVSTLRVPSTIVRVADGKIQILREGAIKI